MPSRISKYTQSFRNQSNIAPLETSSESDVVVAEREEMPSIGEVPEGSIIVPPDHPDFEFLKNRPEAGAEAYGCVMVDKKMFAKLFYACVTSNTSAVTGEAGIRFFSELLGVRDGNRVKFLEVWQKYKDFHLTK